jgi:hypothetical protein
VGLRRIHDHDHIQYLLTLDPNPIRVKPTCHVVAPKTSHRTRVAQDRPVTQPAQATLADWLALHAVTAAALRPFLAPHPAAPPVTPAPPPFAPTPVTVAATLARALPPLEPTLARLLDVARFDLAPDPARFPRAFTLADDGTGRPFVSVPLDGTATDLLVLAHEIGHACQALTPGAPLLPPIQRETAALLCEHALAQADPRLAPHLARRIARMARHTPALARALDHPDAPYGYAWNYPVALTLAARATRRLTVADRTSLVTAPGPLAPLLARLSNPD